MYADPIPKIETETEFRAGTCTINMAQGQYTEDCLKLKIQEYLAAEKSLTKFSMANNKDLRLQLTNLKRLLMYSRTFVQDSVTLGVLEHPIIYANNHELVYVEGIEICESKLREEYILQKLDLPVVRSIYLNGITVQEGAKLLEDTVELYKWVLCVVFVTSVDDENERVPLLTLITKRAPKCIYYWPACTPNITPTSIMAIKSALVEKTKSNWTSEMLNLDEVVPKIFRVPTTPIMNLVNGLFYCLPSTDLVLSCIVTKRQNVPRRSGRLQDKKKAL